MSLPNQSPPAAARTCGGCTLCCKLMAISALAKPAGIWCPNCAMGEGCRIYPDRPAECRSFACGWLVDPKLGEEWQPSRSRIVLVAPQGQNRLAAHVDPTRADAWRREPFYERLKQWGRAAAQVGGQVVVYVGRRATVILPDRDVELGVMGDGDVIVVSVRMTAHGPQYDARRAPRDTFPTPSESHATP